LPAARRLTLPAALLCAALLLALPVAAQARAHATVPGEVVVGLRGHLAPRVLRVHDVGREIGRLRRHASVRYAVPNVVARASAAYVPDDPGRGTDPGGWQQTQWNFTGPASVNAPDAWGHLIDAGHPGGRGVTIAVLDTGIAYRRFGRTPASPDLAGTKFVKGYDFIGKEAYANDRNGHGTHVASTIAETTNNGIGVTGLAYGATIMPVKVLTDKAVGDATEIAKGVRFAARHGAAVINMSLEFPSEVTAEDLPQLVDAIDYAHRLGAVVVAASGNEAGVELAFPARADYVVSVGSTTEHGCLSDFSNQGPDLDLVAPGGGPDAYLSDAGCQPNAPAGRNIAQLTLIGDHRVSFGIPAGYEGTSMAVPHVSAAAALVIASGLLGAHPSPAAVERRLERTATDLGPAGHDSRYGYGRLDAGAATDPAVPVT